MDALRHADEILAALLLRHPEFAMPGHVGSPMDDRATLVIPQALIEACEPGAVAGLADGPLDQELRRVAAGRVAGPLRDIA